MALYETDSYHYTSVAADFAEHEQRVVQPESGYIYGPYPPYSEEEIAELEANTFGAKLTDIEKLALEGAHQYAVRGAAYRSIGEYAVADLFEAQVPRIIGNIKRVVDSDDPERLYISNASELIPFEFNH